MNTQYDQRPSAGERPDVQLIYVPPEQRANEAAYVAEEIRKYEEARARKSRPTRSGRKPSSTNPTPAGRIKPVEPKEDLTMLSPEERHSRKCHVCNHPEREAIEESFVHWVRPTAICRQYDVPWTSLYRHAEAKNLKPIRSRNLRSVLDKILERGVESEVTGDTVLRAVKYYTCLTDDNKWIEPATQVVFATKPAEPAGLSANRKVPALQNSAPMIDIAVAANCPLPADRSPLIDTPND